MSLPCCAKSGKKTKIVNRGNLVPIESSPQQRAPFWAPCTKRRLLVAGFGVMLFLLLSAVTHRTINIPLNGGGSVTMENPSVLEWFFTSTCAITFSPRPGIVDSVDFGQGWFDAPIMVLPSTNTNVFLCIYDHDVDWQLIRIDLSQRFQPIPLDNPLHGIVRHSTCKIDRVPKSDANDWSYVAATLDKMPGRQYREQSRGLNLLFFRLRAAQKDVAASMRNFGDQGQYPGDVVTPWYMSSSNK